MIRVAIDITIRVAVAVLLGLVIVVAMGSALWLLHFLTV